MPSDLIEAAPAKVNLFLHVTGRRPDGYHLLDSLVVFPPIGDVLSADIAETLSLRVEGPFAAALTDEADNLVMRAARALATEAKPGVGARIVLKKNLPVASGIGGGSADAAATLRLLSRLWNILPDRQLLENIAARLGADVTVCLGGCPIRMSGIGELVAPPPALPDGWILLLNPGVRLATADVFRARRGAWSRPAALPASWPNTAAMAVDLARLKNDLEPPAIALQPVIGKTLEKLAATPNCLLARMSGSGATCFALYSDPASAKQALRQVEQPRWWCWAGALAG